MKEAVELVEAFADARTNKERRLIKAARQIARQLFELEHRVEGGNYIDPPTAGYYLLDSLIRVAAPDAASETPDRCSHYERAVGRSSAVGDETRRRLLTDIYGNWFRRTRINSRWRTADVLGLARGIYDERAFDRLPLLADALMDAGCDSEDVLSHCRGEGPHVRGCWVVDLVLGKE